MANSTSVKPADAGKSTIASFRYNKGVCIVVLKNGVQGIIGSNADCPLHVMLGLKGSGVEIAFKKADKQVEGEAYTRYFLSWSLE